jgi:hypothetical protein
MIHVQGAQDLMPMTVSNASSTQVCPAGRVYVTQAGHRLIALSMEGAATVNAMDAMDLHLTTVTCAFLLHMWTLMDTAFALLAGQG